MELVATDLTCARGGLAVVEGVSFRVGQGRALILRGPNGSGKTTLLRTLAGLQPPAAGRVAPGPDAIAYAGHADAVKATLTVAENLRFWAAIHGTRDIAPALAAFALEPLAGRQAQHLSAGQRRRLGLARIAVTGRPVWALDEPTVSLDAASVAGFAAAVRAHVSAGGIAVIATHTDLGIDAETLDLTRFAARTPVDAFEAGFG
jgi:heme exporter protein A